MQLYVKHAVFTLLSFVGSHITKLSFNKIVIANATEEALYHLLLQFDRKDNVVMWDPTITSVCRTAAVYLLLYLVGTR